MMSPVNVASRQHSLSGSPAPGAIPVERHAGYPPSPAAARVAGRTWRDPRLFVGVGLVALCVLLGAQLLAGADDTVPVWSVRDDVPAGTVLAAGDLERMNLRFSSAELAGRYLSADQPLPTGTVLTRDVAAGELLPRAAIGSAAAADTVEVPVAVPSEAVPASLRPGEVVDVWVTPSSDIGRQPRALRVLEQVRVVAAPRSGSALGPSTTRQVVVAVPAEDENLLASALARLADGAAVLVRRG